MTMYFYEKQVTFECFDIKKYVKKYGIPNTDIRTENNCNGVDNVQQKHYKLEFNTNANDKQYFEHIKNELLNLLNTKNYKTFLQKITDLSLPCLKKQDYDLFAHTPYKNEVAGEFGIDYVNASFIPLHDGKRFIAAQAPKEKYVDRFNELIKRSKCSLMVCLANLVNEGMVEYEQDESFCTSYETNSSKKNEGAKYQRIVCDGWVDMNNPKDEMLEKVYSEFLLHYKLCNKDIIVHCKAGLGRTGVFIFHHILKTIKTSNNNDFLTIFLYLRSKRNHLVYNEKQLRHIHEIFIDENNNNK